jgi:hypothetical protein
MWKCPIFEFVLSKQRIGSMRFKKAAALNYTFGVKHYLL